LPNTLGQSTPSFCSHEPRGIIILEIMATTIRIAHETPHSPDALPPADIRIQQFLNEYLADVCPRGAPRLPDRTLPAIRSGQAREWSFPAGKDYF